MCIRDSLYIETLGKLGRRNFVIPADPKDGLDFADRPRSKHCLPGNFHQILVKGHLFKRLCLGHERTHKRILHHSINRFAVNALAERLKGTAFCRGQLRRNPISNIGTKAQPLLQVVTQPAMPEITGHTADRCV